MRASACAVERPSTNKTQPSRRARGWATITRTDTKHHQGKKNGLAHAQKSHGEANLTVACPRHEDTTDETHNTGEKRNVKKMVV